MVVVIMILIVIGHVVAIRIFVVGSTSLSMCLFFFAEIGCVFVRVMMMMLLNRYGSTSVGGQGTSCHKWGYKQACRNHHHPNSLPFVTHLVDFYYYLV